LRLCGSAVLLGVMAMRWSSWTVLGSLLLVLALSSCAYRLVPGPLTPLDEGGQGEGCVVSDDGTVTYHIERLRISLKPMSDEELNRQFAAESAAGGRSTNPYTFGDWSPEGDSRVPARFTVFLLAVENYNYPKVLLHPERMRAHSQNSRSYDRLSFEVLREYYYPYNRAYAGNASARFGTRKDLLKRTMYPDDEYVFAGVSEKGYVVFPPLHDDVKRISIHLDQVGLRFDFRDEATLTTDLVFNFEREVRRE